MAKDDNKDQGDGAKKDVVEVPVKVLTEMQEQMAKMEREAIERDARYAGVEAMLAESQAANTEGPGKKLRERKTFEPAFRYLRLRKFPIAGDHENLGIVVGWNNRGAYQEVDVSGVTRQIVDYIDIAFLGQERSKEGKLKYEKVKLLDLLNNSFQESYKIVDTKVSPEKVPTNEEIDITVFDPAHGMVATGEKIDGYTMFTNRSYLVAIPGHEDTWIDEKFAN